MKKSTKQVLLVGAAAGAAYLLYRKLSGHSGFFTGANMIIDPGTSRGRFDAGQNVAWRDPTWAPRGFRQPPPQGPRVGQDFGALSPTCNNGYWWDPTRGMCMPQFPSPF